MMLLEVDAGNKVFETNFDAWGRRRNVDDWTYTNPEPFVETGYDFSWLTRGYTGHEHLAEFGLINMNGRLYDPILARMLSPDNYVQDATSTQNFNRYSYCINNPLKYTDPSGEGFFLALLPWLIGAVVGIIIGNEIANSVGAKGFDRALYIIGGAIIGGVSGYLGAGVAGAGGIFANTSAIAAGSFSSAVGFKILSGGRSDVSIGFGAASYNIDKNDWGYLGEKGNSTLENVGYGLGALANISDLFAGFKPEDITLRTENDPNFSDKGDIIGHSQLTKENEVLIDWGPDGWSAGPFDRGPGTNSYEMGQLVGNQKGTKFWNPIEIKGVNIKTINNFKSTLDKGENYQMFLSSCVSKTSAALNRSGVFNIGIHPYFLHTQMYLRSVGFRPILSSFYFTR